MTREFRALLRDFWHPVALSANVKGKPVAVRLLGTHVVVWRDGDDICAFNDLCIHRGTRLSLGWVDNGELVCPYHGWCYGRSGAVTRIPAIPSDRPIPAKARVEKYHCMERYGLVFVCLGEPKLPIYEVPDIPTVAEAALPGFDVDIWMAVAVAAGTPPEVIARLNAALNQALLEKDVIDQLAKVGIDARTSTSVAASEFVDREVKRWPAVIEAAGLAPK